MLMAAAQYKATGFYVIEGAVGADEIREMQEEFEDILANQPAAKGSDVDARGRPVRYPQRYNYSDAMSDPAGGGDSGVFNLARPGDDLSVTEQRTGRHQMKMREPRPPPHAPRKVLANWGSPMQYADSDTLVRAYGHPSFLKIAEAINGEDFVPFTETMWYKAPYATSTAWHQDPSASWDEEWAKPGFDVDKMGFSFHLSLYDGNAINSLWMLPGSQGQGRIDINALSASGDGSDRLPGAVPILLKPGDCFIQSRTALHGAFANMSDEPRCTFQFGFNKRATVHNITTKGYGFSKWCAQRAFRSRGFDGPLGSGSPSGSIRGDGSTVTYDDEYLHQRSKMIQWAISARSQYYPDEEPYVYKPLADEAEELVWSPELRDDPEAFQVMSGGLTIVV